MKQCVARCSTAKWLGLASISLLGLVLAAGAGAQQDASASVDEPYRYSAGSQDGTGKFYMGREISRVMGHQGAGWLERPSRQDEERTDLLIDNMPISPGDSIADIGAGTGYFSLPMARIVGDAGTVYAVDIQPEMLAIIEQRATEEGISNVRLVLAASSNPRLPNSTIDMALFVDAYHEFEWPKEVMSGVYDSLVPGGKVLLIEYRAEDSSVAIKPLHKMTERQARAEMQASGFEFVENRDILPQQHFLIFEKPRD